MKANEAPQQYISKSALVSEINKLYNGEIDTYTRNILDKLKSNIDTLEVKDANLNKELSLEDYKSFFEKYPDLSDDWGFNEAWIFAKYFFELGMAVGNKQIEEKEDINSPEEECNVVYKDITIINRDGNVLETKIEQREKL